MLTNRPSKDDLSAGESHSHNLYKQQISPKSKVQIKMNNLIRSVRTHTATVFLSKQLGEKASGVGFRQVTTMASTPGMSQQSKDKSQIQNPNEKTEDVMSHSFGEGYATRADEEGFGGTCGGQQATRKIELDQEIHEGHPAYDKTQGSEVKEKERARHQTNAAS